MVKQWSRLITRDQLNSYEEKDLIYWKDLADIIHFSPNKDFADKTFLSKCFS